MTVDTFAGQRVLITGGGTGPGWLLLMRVFPFFARGEAR